jgi:exosortase
LGFLCFGSAWVKRHLFPLAFLIFMIPMPGWVEAGLEKALMVPSAAVAEWFFEMGGIPIRRDGQLLQLPGVTLEVASECSGIRSSYVLFIVSLLASHLILKGPVRRASFVLAVLPLGVVRNAFRIYVIGWLCVNRGNEMLDHWIHRKGGPLFFAVSLLPLFLLGYVLSRSRKPRPGQGAGGAAGLATQGTSSR